MPAKEIKELRQAGRLEEALTLAKAELESEPDNIWAKRNISWVYYDYLKQSSSPEHFDAFISWLNEIKHLQLPVDEKMLFEQLCWQVGKMAFGLLKANPVEVHKIISLFESIESIQFPKPSEGYSFLFKGLHKALKETDRYVQFADWWDFKNFMPGDFQKEKMTNGKEVMAIAEQAYIAYAKHLLPKQTQFGEMVFDKEKAMAFLPILSDIVDTYPQFQYPAYFNAKLLLALGDKDHMLSALLPFAKKKRNDFWVWEILAEAFSDDSGKVFACYCKALSCKSPEEMLVSLRQKMAGLLISKKLYNEAKTEIELLVEARNSHGFKIPNEVINWQSQDWYKTAVFQKSNFAFYKQFIPTAEALLFSDTPEETVIVEFVNAEKKILNFIASELKFGFFKYDRFLKDVTIGDTLIVRFQSGAQEGMYQLYTAAKVNNETFKKQFLKEVEGAVKIPPGKSFGFLGDVFVHPSLVAKLKLTDGMHLKAHAIKTYNQDKKVWSWKVCSI
ncbi:MAG: hypothetical protein QM791_13255 [Ferruginibacter sp.]